MGVQAHIAYTLEARAEVQAVAFAQNTRDEVRLMGGDGQIVGALAAQPGMKQTCYIAQSVPAPIGLSGEINANIDLIGTLDAGSRNGGGQPSMVLNGGMAVRRLTPRECERLQGFDDDYTLIPIRNGMAADGPRYKALGNSWAIPNVRWIGARMDRQMRATA